MATKLASFGGPNPHTAGLFADMTVDGPEIGTLVLVVDRAKNLPNRKTMGKQNPYCAARLGKEAKKTETDKRGGQTPRWDQELRFTVHDSPDYHSLKISIFSEDKRTDLIGEAWVSLKDILNPGGGKADLWQGMNYKGKYAGELRIELTYYDTRPKPEGAPESIAGEEDFRQSVGGGSGRVKRRPLPSNPNSGHVTPDTIPQPTVPGRPKNGPRDLRTPLRANSMPPESVTYTYSQPVFAAPTPIHGQNYGSSPGAPMYHTPPSQLHSEYNGHDVYADPYEDSPGQPFQLDFLPQLPPSDRQRASILVQPRMNNVHGQTAPHLTPQGHMGLPHSHSSPAVPLSNHDADSYDDGHQLRLEYPEPIPDLDYQYQQVGARQRRSDISPNWEAGYQDPYSSRQMPTHETHDAPPPPPVHSNSAPVVPHYGHSPSNSLVMSTPASVHSNTPYNRHHSVPNSSPLQSIERTYGTPPRSSVNGYMSSPEQSPHEMTPPNHLPGQTPSPYARPQPLRPSPNRHSVADPYNTTPSRPHPLSQVVHRPHSPQPYYAQELPGSSPQSAGHSPYEHDYRGRNAVPLIKPRAISPQPARPLPQSNSAPRPKSSYSIQHPVRSFESSDNSPLSTSRPNTGINTQIPRTSPHRKSITPQATTPNSAGGGMPFSPDSFDVHNPNARQPTLPVGNSPHMPYQVRPGSAAVPQDGKSGPIVGWHGQEIDPSDHLPVDSWAPEPEKKTPIKTYGLGRDRDFGPRSAQNSESRQLSKDTVVNVRPRSQTLPSQEEQSPSRNKLQKKSGGRSPIEPLKERHNYNSVSVPDPYAQNEYSQSFYQSNEGGYASYGPPSSSPTDMLTREISSIDIGSGRYSRGGSVPAPASYVPVRSHKDRRTYY